MRDMHEMPGPDTKLSHQVESVWIRQEHARTHENKREQLFFVFKPC